MIFRTAYVLGHLFKHCNYKLSEDDKKIKQNVLINKNNRFRRNTLKNKGYSHAYTLLLSQVHA